MEADVVVSAFATPPQESIRAMAQNTTLFDSPPVVLGVPYQDYLRPEHKGIASSAFAEAASRLRRPNGSVLEGFFARYAKGYHPRSVTLIGFSAGCTFVKRCLEGPDAEWIDTVIALDGLHIAKDWREQPLLSDAEPWLRFARLAAADKRLMVVAHTAIVPTSIKLITSTTESARLMYDQLWESAPRPLPAPVVAADWDLMAAGPPPPEVSITGGNPRATKRYPESPLRAVDQLGNCWFLDYGGGIGCDHIYVSWYGQRDIWRAFLAPRLNAGQLCRAPSLAGLGQCEPFRVTVPADVYVAQPILSTLGPAIGGLAAGAGLGYLFGKALGA